MQRSETGQALEVLVWEVFQSFYRLRLLGKQMGMMGEDGEGHWSVLQTLALEGDRSVAQLAHARALSEAAMQKLADALLADGSVEQVPDPLGSAPRLHLTAKGANVLQGLSLKMERVIELMAKQMRAEDIEHAIFTLREMQHQIGRLTGE